MRNPLTTKEFLTRINELNLPIRKTGIKYTSMHQKIQLWCTKHREPFWVTPHNLLKNGSGCNNCTRERRSASKKLTNETFLKKTRSIHGDLFTYYNDYKDSTTKIKIGCKIHGIFKQTPANHLQGNGCPKCGLEKTTAATRLTTKEFIKRVKDIFPNYKFNKTKYTNNTVPVTLTCIEHGDFSIKPDYILYKQMGCPLCIHYKGGIYNNNFDWETYGHNKGILYILKLKSKHETFYKIGISRQQGEKRINQFRSGVKDFYHVDAVYKITGPLKEMWEQERRILKETHRYRPKQQFGGWTECFQINNLEEII